MPKGVYIRTKENIERIKRLRIGKRPWNKGIPRSEETKVKISEKKIGNKMSVEARMNISNGHKGEKNWNWKGGISPERQSFYTSLEWAKIVPIIWARDKKTCQRCRVKYTKENQFHIHHKVSFQNRELRIEPNNLVLICRKCHYWIHSNKNINKEFLKICI